MTRAVFNVETIEQILKVTQAEVARLQDALTKSNALAAEWHTRAEAAEAEVTRLKGEMVTLTTQNTAWLDKYGDCQNQMYAAIERAEKAEAERDKARNYAKEARMRENKAEDARVSASFRATKAESDLEILRGELEKNAKNALETMLKLSRDISALTAERDQLKWSMEKYEDRAEKAEEKTARLRTLLAPFADMLDVLEEPSTTTAGAEHETTFAAPDDFIIQAFPVPCHEEEKSSDYVTLCTVGDIRKARKALEEK